MNKEKLKEFIIKMEKEGPIDYHKDCAHEQKKQYNLDDETKLVEICEFCPAIFKGSFTDLPTEIVLEWIQNEGYYYYNYSYYEVT